MAITIVGAKGCDFPADGANETGYDFRFDTPPSGVEEGDLMLVFAVGLAAGFYSKPNGWSLDPNSGGVGDALYTKVAEENETGPYEWSETGSPPLSDASRSACMIVVRGGTLGDISVALNPPPEPFPIGAVEAVYRDAALVVSALGTSTNPITTGQAGAATPLTLQAQHTAIYAGKLVFPKFSMVATEPSGSVGPGSITGRQTTNPDAVGNVVNFAVIIEPSPAAASGPVETYHDELVQHGNLVPPAEWQGIDLLYFWPGSTTATVPLGVDTVLSGASEEIREGLVWDLTLLADRIISLHGLKLAPWTYGADRLGYTVDVHLVDESEPDLFSDANVASRLAGVTSSTRVSTASGDLDGDILGGDNDFEMGVPFVFQFGRSYAGGSWTDDAALQANLDAFFASRIEDPAWNGRVAVIVDVSGGDSFAWYNNTFGTPDTPSLLVNVSTATLCFDVDADPALTARLRSDPALPYESSGAPRLAYRSESSTGLRFSCSFAPGAALTFETDGGCDE